MSSHIIYLLESSMCICKELIFCFFGVNDSVYILGIRPLSDVSLANMFSHTVGSLCNLALFSLAMQMRYNLFILSFMSLALGDVSVRVLLHGMSEIFLPTFSSRTFTVL